MGRVFLSYRREDSIDVTGRIFDRLADHFGRDAVFMDVDTIPFGVDFRAHFSTWIDTCDVVLVIIGDGWLGARYADGAKVGTRRLEDAADFVRIEVSAALARDVPVVPVLVGGGEMPAADELPDDLRSLAYRNAAEVRSGRDFHGHMDRLIRGIEQVLGAPAPRPEPPPLRPSSAPPPAPVATASDERSLADVLAMRVAIPEPAALQIVLRALDQITPEAPLLDPRRVLLGPPHAEPIPYLRDAMPGEAPGDYSAPHTAEADVSSSAVYAAGQILWELLMGAPAFTGSGDRVRAAKRRQVSALKLPQAPFSVSATTEHLIARATQPHPAKRAGVLELVEMAAKVLPDIAPPDVVVPVNLDFAGDVVAGFPHGWFDSRGYVSRASTAYAFAPESRDGRRCVRMFRTGAHSTEFGSLMQRIPAGYLSGRNVRLRAEVCTERVEDTAGLWMRADGAPRATDDGDLINTMLFFDNMSDRPITGTTPWTRYEIETVLPAGVQHLNYGVLLNGDGTVWVADVDLKVWTYDGRWQSLAWEKLTSSREGRPPPE